MRPTRLTGGSRDWMGQSDSISEHFLQLFESGFLFDVERKTDSVAPWIYRGEVIAVKKN